MKFGGHLEVTRRTWSWGEVEVIGRTLKGPGSCRVHWDLHTVSPDGGLLGPGSAWGSCLRTVPGLGTSKETRASPYFTPAEKLTTGKKSPSRLKASKTPCTGQPLMRKEMDGTLRSRQQLTTSSAARRCCPGEVTGRATCPAAGSPGKGQKSEVPWDQ